MLLNLSCSLWIACLVYLKQVFLVFHHKCLWRDLWYSSDRPALNSLIMKFAPPLARFWHQSRCILFVKFPQCSRFTCLGRVFKRIHSRFGSLGCRQWHHWLFRFLIVFDFSFHESMTSNRPRCPNKIIWLTYSLPIWNIWIDCSSRQVILSPCIEEVWIL